MSENKSPMHSPDHTPPPPTGGQGGVVMIARVMGILCVAGGFMLGMQGLDHPDSPLLPTALGLIVTGIIAQVFAFVKVVSSRIQGKG